MESRPPEPGPDDTGRDPDLQELAEAYARTGHPRLREMVVLCCQDWSRGLARGVARGSAAEPDDLSQVAALAVMRALDRYDPAIGPFEPYARATVAGEVRHYLRATEWPLRVPRRYQEAYRRLARARDDLGKGAAGCPLEQLGKVAGIPEGDLEPVGALRRRTESLERGAETGQIDGWLARIDGGMESVPERTDLRRAIERLDHRDRELLYLYYYRDSTQRQMARALGTNQVRISRLLTQALNVLRDQLRA